MKVSQQVQNGLYNGYIDRVKKGVWGLKGWGYNVTHKKEHRRIKGLLVMLGTDMFL